MSFRNLWLYITVLIIVSGFFLLGSSVFSINDKLVLVLKTAAMQKIAMDESKALVELLEKENEALKAKVVLHKHQEQTDLSIVSKRINILAQKIAEKNVKQDSKVKDILLESEGDQGAFLSENDRFLTTSMDKSILALREKRFQSAADGFQLIVSLDKENVKAKIYGMIAEYNVDPRNASDKFVENLDKYLQDSQSDEFALKALSVFYSEKSDWRNVSLFLGQYIDAGYGDQYECILEGSASVLAGDVERAKHYFDLAIGDPPHDAKKAYDAGKIFERNKLPEDAIKYYSIALIVDSSYEQAREALQALQQQERKDE